MDVKTAGPKEPLAVQAVKVADQLADQLLVSSRKDTLEILEFSFPGITERVAQVVNPEAIKGALSAHVGTFIKSLILEGTEDSLCRALDAVRELRSLVERGGGVDLEAVKELMPGRVVGPDAKIFKGKDIGKIPELPSDILEILKSKCELANDGRTVAETHRLVLVPAAIDGEPLTLNSLRNWVRNFDQGSIKGSIFRHPVYGDTNRPWYVEEGFANTPLKKSVWVLDYENIAPGTLNKNDGEQTEVVAKFANYRTARLLEHVGTLAFQLMENHERLHLDYDGVCDEWTSHNREAWVHSHPPQRIFIRQRVYVLNDVNGISLDDTPDYSRWERTGRAVVRKLDT
jgi:hypothetical protein